MNNKITNIVVSRYKKKVKFILKLNKNTKYFVYDKETPNNPLNIPVNKGNEASVYLKYIIDYYDELSDFTFFIHDEEYAWHHSGSIINKYKEAINSNRYYYNINDKCFWNRRNIIINDHGIKIYNFFLNWYRHFLEEYIPFSKIPNNKDFLYGYRGSAQFLVHKNLIRNFPKEFYIKLYNWIITTEIPNYFSGRFLEWTWHVMWYIYPLYIKEN
jgi:hypothetical protein